VTYYLGIDGGGTKTACAVGDDNRLLASVTAGPSNIVRVGEMQARESLHRVVGQACVAAGIRPEQVSGTCVGGSGATRPELAAIVHAILAEILSSPIKVVGDMEIALEAAFKDGPGVMVIAGTGSMAYGRDDKGRTARAGGWGFEIGDEGSAHWIGRTAVSAALRASDRETQGVAVSALGQALCKSWGVSTLLDLARAANSVPSPNFAALFRSVVACDDDLAREVLGAAGRELAEIAALVIRRVFVDDRGGLVRVAMTGSVFRHASLVRDAFYNELKELAPRAEVMAQVVDPVEGALHMARKIKGQAG
jgi:N-acetylglucosamine kinase-like BadF-type ATPase